MAEKEKRADISRLNDLVSEHRDKLLAELHKIDPNLVLEIGVTQGDIDMSGHFSDWHDNWRDGPRWSKTWGKAGDKLIKPLHKRLVS